MTLPHSRVPPTPALPHEGGGWKIFTRARSVPTPSPLVGEGRGGGDVEKNPGRVRTPGTKVLYSGILNKKIFIIKCPVQGASRDRDRPGLRRPADGRRPGESPDRPGHVPARPGRPGD